MGGSGCSECSGGGSASRLTLHASGFRLSAPTPGPSPKGGGEFSTLDT